MTSIELFAGGGGLALGLEKAGFKHILLNEYDKHAANTLKTNRNWNVINDDIRNIDFTPYKGQVDLLSGGIPCQAFSYAGKQLGFEDTRGTLFFEFARALKETEAKMFLIENVKGLFTHDNKRTMQTMFHVLEDLGYKIFKPQVLDASYYNVPQRRERLFIVGIRKELPRTFEYPEKQERTVLKDALLKGKLYDTDVPPSEGVLYSEYKKSILDLVPEGGYWKHLPVEIQKQYMGKAYNGKGGSTGMARRTSMEEACFTLMCSPAQKLTERCHPKETRPFQIREYARIQTFPDDWKFQGPLGAQYRQIGNAVPVNLAYEIGKQIKATLEGY